MKVLIVKMSSMGDVIHTLPAVTDARAALEEVDFDWVVEESFAGIAALHPGIRQVLPIEFRRWRQCPWQHRVEFRRFCARLREQEYDLVIDAQGLIKSAVATRLARGVRVGFDWHSARESMASLAYTRRHHIDTGRHAIDRLRELFARALDYPVPSSPVDYGLASRERGSECRYILLVHGTSWPSKHWPTRYWEELARLVRADGYVPLVPAGSMDELQRASRIAAGPPAEILDRLPFAALAERLRECAGAVAVDTGLGHLAAAFDVPMVSLFGPTDPALTGPRGPRQTTLQGDHLPCIPCLNRTCRFDDDGGPYPPCFDRHTPAQVWQTLREQLA